MKPSQGIVTLTTFQDGEYVPKPYKLFSARLPDFLERFPPTKGWRVVRSFQAACELSPTLTRLHEAAINGGKSPESVGLPPIPSGFVMTARLVDPQGQEVASGSAFCMGLDLQYAVPAAREGNGEVLRKDFEAGETAAFQRLLAAVGLGGDALDADESRTMADMGKTPAAPAPDEPSATATSKTRGKGVAKGAGPAGNLLDRVSAVPCPAKDGRNTVLSASEPVAQTVQVVEVGSGAGDQARLRSMQQQIGRIAKQLGVEAKPVSTLDEASAELGRLGALVKQRSVNR